jgi:hypothetical protein
MASAWPFPESVIADSPPPPHGSLGDLAARRYWRHDLPSRDAASNIEIDEYGRMV